MSTWHYFNVNQNNQNMHLIVLLAVLCVRWYDVWAAAEPLLGCCVLCQTETQTPDTSSAVGSGPSLCCPACSGAIFFMANKCPKCLNRHHNANEDVLCIVYCTHPLLQFLRRHKTTLIPQCPLCSIILFCLTLWCQYLHPSSQLSPQTSVLHGAVTRSPDIYLATRISTHLHRYLDIYISKYLSI